MDEFIGKKFGSWTVVDVCPREMGTKKLKPLKYRCHCDCGGTGEVNKTCLVNGRSLSCGCYTRQRVSETMSTHGLSRTPLYVLWASIKARTTNPNTKSFDRYGALGVRMSDEWLDNFPAFYDYVMETLGPKPSPQHSIDRVKNDGHYEPGNVRWATPEEQSSNRSSNIVVIFQGITDTLTRHCKRLGLNPKAVNLRVSRRGWTPEEALSTPTDGKRHSRPGARGPVETLADQCRARGLDYSIVKSRVGLGWTVEEALSAPTDGERHRRPNQIESVETLAGQCRTRGCDYAAVKERVRAGWSVEAAMSTPTDGKPHFRLIEEQRVADQRAAEETPKEVEEPPSSLKNNSNQGG